MGDRFYTYKRVGYFNEKMAEDLGVKFTGTIYASQGVIRHIKKKHGKHLGRKITNNIIDYMKEIIDKPDYIGVYKFTTSGIHIEFIRKAEPNILIGIDDTMDYIYVSTMYPITDGKIDRRLFSGKLIAWR